MVLLHVPMHFSGFLCKDYSQVDFRHANILDSIFTSESLLLSITVLNDTQMYHHNKQLLWSTCRNRIQHKVIWVYYKVKNYNCVITVLSNYGLTKFEITAHYAFLLCECIISNYSIITTKCSLCFLHSTIHYGVLYITNKMESFSNKGEHGAHVVSAW